MLVVGGLVESADQLLDEVAAFFRGKNTLVVGDWLASYDARKTALAEEAERKRVAAENWDTYRDSMCQHGSRAPTGGKLSPEEKLVRNVFDED